MKYNLTGRIDTATAPVVDEQIQEAIDKSAEPVTSLTFDCSALDYISSTGLRIILKYKKLYPEFEVINVSNDVFSVFEMTGFSRIMTIKKALRKINLEECQLLAHGANGEVYKINDEEIVKLSLFAHAEANLVKEMEMAREAFVMGVPTAISFDTVEVSDGRTGIVMEALNSTTLAQQLKEHPEQLDSFIEPYINLFRTTNSIVGAEGQFRDVKRELIKRLYVPQRFLDDATTAVIGELAEALPDGNRLVHCDGHPCNALICGDGSTPNLMLIDMGDFGMGHPIMEILGWSFLMNGPDFSPARFIAPRVLGLDYDFTRLLIRKMLASYLNITDEATLDYAVEAAAYVGTLRLVILDMVRIKTEDKKARTRTMAAGIVEHKQDILDAIRFLTDLIDKQIIK